METWALSNPQDTKAPLTVSPFGEAGAQLFVILFSVTGGNDWLPNRFQIDVHGRARRTLGERGATRLGHNHPVTIPKAAGGSVNPQM